MVPLVMVMIMEALERVGNSNGGGVSIGGNCGRSR